MAAVVVVCIILKLIICGKLFNFRLLGSHRERKIDICGGKECMKKELRILVILIAVLLVGTVGYHFMPKKLNVNPSEVTI